MANPYNDLIETISEICKKSKPEIFFTGSVISADPIRIHTQNLELDSQDFKINESLEFTAEDIGKKVLMTEVNKEIILFCKLI